MGRYEDAYPPVFTLRSEMFCSSLLTNDRIADDLPTCTIHTRSLVLSHQLSFNMHPLWNWTLYIGLGIGFSNQTMLMIGGLESH